MDKEFVRFMKVLEEITFEHKHLKRVKQKAKGKEAELRLSARMITIFR